MSDFGDDETGEPSAARERMGRYELVSEIASGGMGSVFLARLLGDADVARVVAIKRIHPHLARSPGVAEMFLDEARIAARIDHPNVCQVYEYGREAGASFLAMEFLAGESLLSVVRRLAATRASLDPLAHAARVAFVIAEVCDGLHAAHEVRDANGERLDVVHRDVSPHNVFVTFDGAVKVVDFGIASASSRLHHTETGTIKGKFAYMAPEQLRGARADRRADVWAVGVVLWELLTLRRLFRNENPSAVVQAVESQPIALPSEVLEGLPVAFDAIAARALQRDLAQRTATAQSLSTELREAIHRLGVKVDRGEIAAWMATLFPDGAQRRERWIREAHAQATPTPSSSLRVDVQATPPVEGPTRSERHGDLPDASTPQLAAPTRPGSARIWMVVGVLAAFSVALVLGRVGETPPETALADEETSVAVPIVVSTPVVERVSVEAPMEAPPPPVAAPPVAPTPTRRRAPQVANAVVSTAPEPTLPACLTLGAGVSVELAGTTYEGPRATCITTQPGDHAIRLVELATGTVLWDGPLSLHSGERRALTVRSRR